MAQLSDLVRVVAAVTGMEEVQVGWIARHLREAGLITQGGRGRGAAKMTYADAAALLIGLNATAQVKEAASVVQELSSYTWEDQRTERYGITPLEIKDRSDDLFDWVLQRSDHGVFGAGNLKLFLERLIYSALPITGAESRLSSVVDHEDVEFYLAFFRPSLRVEFRYSYYSVRVEEDEVVDADGEIFEHGEFVPPPDRKFRDGDRVERVSITHKTILEVGKVLAS